MSQPTESPQDTPFDAPSSLAPTTLDAPPGGAWADFWYNCNQILCLGNALDDNAYRSGFATVVGITLLLSSNSPAVRALYLFAEHPAPPIVLSAGGAAVAAASLFVFGSAFDAIPGRPSTTVGAVAAAADDAFDENARKGGIELGLWKTIGTSFNLYGLAATSAAHGAFLIQLTTLIVPAVQGLRGEPIAPRVWLAIGLALTGVAIFTSDGSGGGALEGDALCAGAAVFYATYDLRLFYWGQRISGPPAAMIRTKVVTQAGLSVALAAAAALWDAAGGREGDAARFVAAATPSDLALLALAAGWYGLVVNAIPSVLQVGAQQAIGPARCQIIYATGPLWAALMAFAFLGEPASSGGLAGGALFLVAIFLAASAPPPTEVCVEDDDGERCEVPRDGERLLP